MLHEVVQSPGERSADDLHDALLAELAAVVERVGVDRAAAETSLDAGTLRTLADGRSAGHGFDLDLAEAAAVLALREGTPDTEAIAAESRDALLLGMTNAVLDVEAVESGLNGELEAREIQAKVEGRYPMTLREFALLYAYIEGHGQ